MTIYLAPALLVFVLLAVASRLRQHIEPACPACSDRRWQSAASTMACASCGWSTSAQVAMEQTRQAA